MTNSATRKLVIERDGCKCFLCSRVTRLEVHHIIEQENGGGEDYNNLITLCRRCHTLNGNHNKLKKYNKRFFKHTKQFGEPKQWDKIIEGNRDKQTKIGILLETKGKIIKLAKAKNLKQITVLEYLLNGKINLDELN